MLCSINIASWDFDFLLLIAIGLRSMLGNINVHDRIYLNYKLLPLSSNI